jgi:hypothetical protein
MDAKRKSLIGVSDRGSKKQLVVGRGSVFGRRYRYGFSVAERY